MSRTFWLASYPKSGNTWVRLLLANLLAGEDGPADINALPDHGSIASARQPFDELMLMDSGLLTHDEVERLRPAFHAAMADERGPDTPPVRFCKTHDAYVLTPDGEPLLGGARGADGVVLIVRDPRDVAPSLAHHNGVSLDRAIDFMDDPAASVCGEPGLQQAQLRQRMPRWGGHVESWLDQGDLPLLLVRYEELAADAGAVLGRVLDFAGVEAGADAIARAAERSAFEAARGQEEARGFRETPDPARPRSFFRQGRSGAWREALTDSQVRRIETAHAPVMARLGYTLSRDLAAPCFRAASKG